LPLIASNIGPLLGAVDEGVTRFLFEPSNFKQLTIKIKLLWNNPELCHQIGLEGQKKHYVNIVKMYITSG